MMKTVVVRVDRLRRHQKYHKYQRVSRRFKAHVDDAQSYRVGDIVLIEEVRPLSKEKRWRVKEVVRKDKSAEDTGSGESLP